MCGIERTVSLRLGPTARLSIRNEGGDAREGYVKTLRHRPRSEVTVHLTNKEEEPETLDFIYKERPPRNKTTAARTTRAHREQEERGAGGEETEKSGSPTFLICGEKHFLVSITLHSVRTQLSFCPHNVIQYFIIFAEFLLSLRHDILISRWGKK